MKLRLLIPSLLFLFSCLGMACGDDAAEGDTREDGGVMQGGDGDGDGDGVISLIDGGVDAGKIVMTCEDAEDGTSCGSMGGLICLGGECVSTLCGDSYTNPLAQEECDDGNDVPSDGCEPDCTFSCSAIGECDDGNACNGNEICDTANHVCVIGTTAVDETPCTSAAVADGECRNGLCVPEGCGDETVEGVEECDDGNQTAGDGCEPTCVFSCSEDADCSDNDVCNGLETCDPTAHLCAVGTALPCDSSDECYQGACDPVGGCSLILIDGDGDRHAPDSLACGDDCDDTRADVNPDQIELCDELDQNCDGEGQPEEAPTWYVDCDADSFATLDAESAKDCEMPAPTACGGRWTTTKPATDDPPTFDCNDAEPAVNPQQQGWFYKPANSSYDYNCDRDETRRWTNGKISVDATCFSFGGTGCTGPAGWTGGIPDCGDRAVFTECQNSGGVFEAAAIRPIEPEPCGIRGCSCGRVTVDRIQQCR
jgi:cysteine-rich repeat protein